jgi:hypothetical protein
MCEEETCTPEPSGELVAARWQGIEHVVKKETARLGLLENVVAAWQHRIDCLLKPAGLVDDPVAGRMSATHERAVDEGGIHNAGVHHIIHGGLRTGRHFLQRIRLTGLWAMGGLILIRTLLNHRQLPVRVKQWPLLAGTLPELEKKNVNI